MTTEDISAPARPALRAFTESAPDDVDEAFRRLVGLLWADGAVTDAAAAAVPDILAALETSAPAHLGHLVLLLGMLAEADPAVHAAVHAGSGRLLDLFNRHADDDRLVPALLYTLGQFPDEREAILKVTAGAGLDADDDSRLHRCLAAPDFADPDVGRAWPSPAVWSLTEDERAIDLRWMPRIPAELLQQLWDRETDMLRAYAGAKALRAAGHGLPGGTETAEAAEPPEPAPRPSSARRDVLGGHGDVLVCPACHGPLAGAGDAAGCAACGIRYDAAAGYLDLVESGSEAPEDLLLRDPIHVPRYLDGLRPAFLRAIGDNWTGAVGRADEDRNLLGSVAPVSGPIVDIASGPGRWSRVLATVFGAERVIALDLSEPMLALLHRTAPEIYAVRAPAAGLPFRDGSLGAAVCWNSLQALTDPAGVIAEVGRCLRPGGSFSLFTFTAAPDPLYRHFQDRHVTPLRVRLFEPAELRSWLAAAGMAVSAESTVGTCLFVTARRAED